MTTTDNPDDAARLAAIAAGLVEAVESALPAWVERSVVRLLDAYGADVGPNAIAAAAEAGRRAVAEVVPALRRLLETDVDEQRSNPLAVLREAVRYPTEVLAEAGVPAVVRDDFAERRFPADVYDLAPASFAEVDPSLHEPGMEWGAAKAHVVLARRRREGRR